MKKRSKLIAAMLSAALVVTLLPATVMAEEKEEVSVNVTIRSQMQGAYLEGFDQEVAVSSNKAETYGYSDSVEGVSVMDALVAAHETVFGEAFTEETCNDLLSVSDSGWTNIAFGVDSATMSPGFMVNEGYPNDGTESSYGGYTGTTVTTQQLVDGDIVDFFYYEDPTWMDNYSFVTVDTDAIANEKMTVSVKGNAVMMGYMYKDPEEFLGAATAVESAGLGWVDISTGEVKAITNENGKAVVTNTDGKVEITAPEKEGTYYLTATSNVEESVYVVMNPSKVEVKAAAEKAPVVTVKKPSISKVTPQRKNKAKVTWRKVSEVSGYQVQYAKKSSFKSAKTVTKSGAKTTSATIKNLKKGKTYYFRVRAYKKVSDKTYYSAWSKAKKAKITK